MLGNNFSNVRPCALFGTDGNQRRAILTESFEINGGNEQDTDFAQKLHGHACSDLPLQLVH